eukprot:6198549-Pleurochrysis_carterae.AAC.5
MAALKNSSSFRLVHIAPDGPSTRGSLRRAVAATRRMSSYLISSRHRLIGLSALHFDGTGCPRNFLPAVVPGPAASSCSTDVARVVVPAPTVYTTSASVSLKASSVSPGPSATAAFRKPPVANSATQTRTPCHARLSPTRMPPTTVPCGKESRATISARLSGSFDFGRRASAPCAAMCCCTRPSAAC